MIIVEYSAITALNAKKHDTKCAIFREDERFILQLQFAIKQILRQIFIVAFCISYAND